MSSELIHQRERRLVSFFWSDFFFLTQIYLACVLCSKQVRHWRNKHSKNFGQKQETIQSPLTWQSNLFTLKKYNTDKDKCVTYTLLSSPVFSVSWSKCCCNSWTLVYGTDMTLQPQCTLHQFVWTNTLGKCSIDWSFQIITCECGVNIFEAVSLEKHTTITISHLNGRILS